MNLPAGPYDILYADPPWRYGGRMTGGSAVDDHYNTMTDAEIAGLPVADVAADNSLLFMWAVSPKLDVAIEVGCAWGFKYATVAFVWEKQRILPAKYTMPRTELCLVFKRGRIPQPRGARNVEQFFSSPRTEHSRKPEEFRRRIDAMFPVQRKLELFARTQPAGWSAAGNEVGKFPPPPPRLF